MAFIPSEQLRLEQRVDQIDEQSGSHQRSQRVVKNHDAISSQLLAGVDIRDGYCEERDRERDHHEVHHGAAPNRKNTSRCLRAQSDFDLHQDNAKKLSLGNTCA